MVETVPPVGPPIEQVISNLEVTLNPTGYAPLSAEVAIATTRPVLAEIVVQGKGGAGTDVVKRFEEPFTEAVLPILGLYLQHENTVGISLFEENGTRIGEQTASIDTSAPSFSAPDIEIVTANPGTMRPGMNLVSYFGLSETPNSRAQVPFMFDAAGDIRWYLDLSGHDSLRYLFYDVGVERLANGNLYFGDGSSDLIVEMDMMGMVVNSWPMDGYGFHHNVKEMEPNGNFLVTVNRDGESTIEDRIIEINRVSGDIVQEWDLTQSMDETRYEWAYTFDDWFHANGLAYDTVKDAIIITGRFQGAIKLTRDNELMWILAPHTSWGTAGDGTDMQTKLLQPLDASGNPITDEEVLNGNRVHPDFEWAWFPHAPELTPNGTLFVFDNGEYRNNGNNRGGPYSRAVEYEIDDENMTVRQVWQYGKERRLDTYSQIVSDVDFHADQNNVMFMPGAVFQGHPLGKAVEIDYDTRAVVFEAVITPDPESSFITFHRIERLLLYSEDS